MSTTHDPSLVLTARQISTPPPALQRDCPLFAHSPVLVPLSHNTVSPATLPPIAHGLHSPYTYPEFSPPHQVGPSDYLPSPLSEAIPNRSGNVYGSRSESSRSVAGGTMFNATHLMWPPFNMHEFGAPVSHVDPATTYLPGYGSFVSREYVEPLELRLQDVPAAELGDGTSFLTVYTLNKQYGFFRSQPAHAAIPANSVTLKCANLLKLIQLYSYFTAPTLSDVAARHHLQTSILGDKPTVELMYGNSTGHSLCNIARAHTPHGFKPEEASPPSSEP
ncbi:hypothetical protein B0H14DRAFT_3776627 [Mycena olivaceomarginata]|nr:hypothetical protein B0H14DRAFT_3776627 [Mycena olivaceomarginata]